MIKEGSYPLQDVIIESQYPDFVTYDSKNNLIHFSGSQQIEDQSFLIKIKLVDSQGHENTYMQTVLIASQEVSASE